jgi:hypothetical protein
MISVCRDRRNHLDFRLGGGGGGNAGGTLPASGLGGGGIVGGMGLTLPELGGIEVGGPVWILPPGGVGGMSGTC